MPGVCERPVSKGNVKQDAMEALDVVRQRGQVPRAHFRQARARENASGKCVQETGPSGAARLQAGDLGSKTGRTAWDSTWEGPVVLG